MEHEEDVVLIQKALDGDEDAFALLFQRYYSFLYKYLIKLTLDEELSKDIAQETMLKCYIHLSSYKAEGKFSTWMISIASRHYIDLLRRKKRERKWLDHVKRSLSRKLSWQANQQGMEWSDVFTDFNQLEADVRVPNLTAPLLWVYLQGNQQHHWNEGRNRQIACSQWFETTKEGVE